MTPLIDVVFLLVLFFVVTSTFEREKIIDLTLPAASENDARLTQPGESEPIEIDLGADGTIGLLGANYAGGDDANLLAAIRQARATSPDADWHLRADARTTHGDVIKLMQSLTRVGIDNLAVHTQTQQ